MMTHWLTGKPSTADGRVPNRSLSLFLNLTGDGLEVRLARARANQVVIRDGRNAAQVERGDVHGFLFGRRKTRTHGLFLRR